MKTTVDIPDEVANELREQAKRQGHDLAEHIVQVVRLGLIIDNIPAATFEKIARALGVASGRPAALQPHNVLHQNAPSAFSADPVTGLLMIDSPPDAPVRSMTPEQVLALTEAALMEDDLERAGIPV
jgi:hypothetical protein